MKIRRHHSLGRAKIAFRSKQKRAGLHCRVFYSLGLEGEKKEMRGRRFVVFL